MEPGLFQRYAGRLIKVDNEAMDVCFGWRTVSDHFPIGARFSFRSRDPRCEHIFVDHTVPEKRQATVMMLLYDFIWGPENLNMRGPEHSVATFLDNYEGNYKRSFNVLQNCITYALSSHSSEGYEALLQKWTDSSLDADPDHMRELLARILDWRRKAPRIAMDEDAHAVEPMYDPIFADFLAQFGGGPPPSNDQNPIS